MNRLRVSDAYDAVEGILDVVGRHPPKNVAVVAGLPSTAFTVSLRSPEVQGFPIEELAFFRGSPTVYSVPVIWCHVEVASLARLAQRDVFLATSLAAPFVDSPAPHFLDRQCRIHLTAKTCFGFEVRERPKVAKKRVSQYDQIESRSQAGKVIDVASLPILMIPIVHIAGAWIIISIPTLWRPVSRAAVQQYSSPVELEKEAESGPGVAHPTSNRSDSNAHRELSPEYASAGYDPSRDVAMQCQMKDEARRASVPASVRSSLYYQPQASSAPKQNGKPRAGARSGYRSLSAGRAGGHRP